MANVRDFGARGDGRTDDTAALAHAFQRGDGHLVFPRGDYLISKPLHLPLQLHGRLAVDGSGGTARLLMVGPGPALQVVGSEIRNLQICSNDIEYNYDLQAETSADVLLDCREGTVREGTIVGNTIQAVQSPGGANVRFLGAGRDNPNAVGLFAVSGNLI